MNVKRVSPEEADRMVKEDGYVYLDVRSIPEFEAGHPSGAYNIPIMHQTTAGMQPNGEFMKVVTSTFDRAAKIVVGCRSGNRSLRAAQMLLQAGFVDVVDQRAGTSGARDPFGQLQEAGWEHAGLDMAMDPHPERSYEALRGRKNG